MFYSAAYDSLLAAGSRYGTVNGCPLPMPPLPSAKLWSPWLHDPRKFVRRLAPPGLFCYVFSRLLNLSCVLFSPV